MQNSSFEGRTVQTRNSSRMFGVNLTNQPLLQLQDRKRSRGKKRAPLGQEWLQRHPEVRPYLEEISQHTRRHESDSYIRDNYMSWHSDINVSMREVLVGWLVEVQPRLNLNVHTLYLAIFLLDKYCHARYISKNKYQLLGLTTLFIAAKYEEVRTPKLKNYAAVSGNECTADQILLMESEVLMTLNFNVKAVTSCWHLQEYIEFARLNDENKRLCLYILDLSLLEFDYCLVKPSLLSWAVVLFVAESRCLSQPQEQQVVDLAKLELKDLREGVASIGGLFRSRRLPKFKAVNEKYNGSIGHLIV